MIDIQSLFNFCNLAAVAPDNNLEQTDATEQPEQAPTTHEPFALAVKAEEPITPNTQPKDETTSQPKTGKSQPSENSSDNESARKEEITPNSEEIFRENTQAMEELFEKANSFQHQESSKKTSKGRRRGVWKLVKHRPLEPIEEAESQNYYTVLNMFDEIKKENKGKGNQKEFTGMNFEQFSNYNPSLEQNSDSYDYESKKMATTDFTEATVKPNDDWSEDGTTILANLEETFPTTTVAEPPTDTQSTSTVNPKPENIFDTLYSMFDFSGDKRTSQESFEPTPEVKDESVTSTTTTTFNPTFPEEITESTSSRNFSELEQETTTVEAVPTTTPPEKPKRTFAVEPWEMKQVRTSTSTEISHETEICYKGKCIKSKKGKIKA